MRRLGEYGALLALLAIPAGVFMYWQNGQKKAKLKASRPPAVASSGPMFQEGSAAETGRKDAPPAAAAAPAAPAPASGQLANAAAVPANDAPASTPAAQPDAAAPAAAPAAGAPAAGGTGANPATEGAPAAPAEGEAAKPASLYAPKTARDPFESVRDRQVIALLGEREVMSRRMAEEARKSMANAKVKKAPKKKSVEDLIQLQGIMEVQGRMTALVNNDMVSKGDIVPGLGIKVVSITSNAVTFSNKGKFIVKKLKEKKAGK